jgi:hypothetical protein
LGLLTQRKPGIDGGKTATLEPHELDDCHLMPGEGNFSESPSMLSRTFVSAEFHDG